MPTFKKKKYTEPVICKHDNDVSKDWYVFFRFKHDGKVYKFKRREGVNRIKKLSERLKAIEELRDEVAFDLKHGWNPISDRKREIDYNPFLSETSGIRKPYNPIQKTKKQREQEIFNKYYYKGL